MFSKFRSRSNSEGKEKPVHTEMDDSISKPKSRWSMGILNDKETDEVPGSVLLLSNVHQRNEPLGLRHAEARTSASSIPSPYPASIRTRDRSRDSRATRHSVPEVKKTADGTIILDPQPDDTPNDPLNWPSWRRDSALLSIGLYCMLGGGVTPMLAAGFPDVAETYHVPLPRVALTTGLCMTGLGIGSVIMSPTAIKFGKRPVYLASAILFATSSVWCALSPNYVSLLIARIVQGISVSPVECLPSATIAEIFFLHERAYRLGVYTLLLLGGKNLVPLGKCWRAYRLAFTKAIKVSAAIIQSLGWRWVFWILAMVIGFCFFLLFLFVPETFWDRTPRARKHHRGKKKPSRLSLHSIVQSHHTNPTTPVQSPAADTSFVNSPIIPSPTSPTHDNANIGLDHGITTPRQHKNVHVGFAEALPTDTTQPDRDIEKANHPIPEPAAIHTTTTTTTDPSHPIRPILTREPSVLSTATTPPPPNHYTDHYRSAPPRTFIASLAPYSGRLAPGNWFLIALRPFILFAYPAVLWSSATYALSVGWLALLSESVSHVYEQRASYNFTSLQVGLVYLAPFIGGILGTVVAGRLSDVVVRWMSRRNDGVYEPEFRLVMALPIAVSTTAGLMGFGWSAQERDAWIVPTVFFGVIGFGCALGSTTAITFCVDSYRQYAGEALVTLNFSKNIFHGLVFSLFFTRWLDAAGPRTVFLATGGLQLFVMLWSIPMYIYGKRARMWTVRQRMMERF
ncbi:MFS general substrate transporter [Pseudovirgaria hyperparasitica]|uniref:MFS general substrate transporter n=1 Tax=Pseudovirgaria hyperparasitica TaxID=470096 RepID=A0A6A6W797_9PEZI|nr:MFS general substrate transporter [Pseudovirgaria hyperparasitica]KAF2757447.1 MFS general substrate transporter [Pseudovirgaria hyperparasitica]